MTLQQNCSFQWNNCQQKHVVCNGRRTSTFPRSIVANVSAPSLCEGVSCVLLNNGCQTSRFETKKTIEQTTQFIQESSVSLSPQLSDKVTVSVNGVCKFCSRPTEFVRFIFDDIAKATISNLVHIRLIIENASDRYRKGNLSHIWHHRGQSEMKTFCMCNRKTLLYHSGAFACIKSGRNLPRKHSRKN